MARSSEDVEEESYFKRYHEICASLNLDRKATDEAWQSYQRINANYTLEGEVLHWLACSLYVACRKASVPMVGRGAFVEGNCVSLTRLLRSCKLSLLQFFIKMKKWADMEHISPEMRQKVERLERNFNVSTVIFKKFEPIYLDIFKDPSLDPPRPIRSRKQRRPPCTSSELFSFCWTLFVHVKGHFSAISDDLVNSYHLLLCCVDLIFANAVAACRKDILKLDFPGLPIGFQSDDFTPSSKPVCIIEWLCDKHQGLVVEAKGIKEHWWNPRIKRMIEKKILKGRSDNLLGLIDVTNFEFNSKSINKEYDSFVLNSGDFDERIFLYETASEEIGTPAKHGAYGSSSIPYQLELKTHIQKHLAESRSLLPSTPLTGRKYLKDKDSATSTPVSMATQSVLRLQTLLASCKPHPSETLVEFFNECLNNPQDSIMSRMNDMGEIFCTAYSSESSDDQPTDNQVDFAKKRLQLAQKLYFKTLENILIDEKKKLPPNSTLANLLEHDLFHRSLIACCLEIVIFSYNSQRLFPWILEIFDLQAYYFYRVIEVLIRGESGFYRDVVKHLNHIEEQMLESLAWKNESAIWDSIKASDLPIPTCEEVSLPAHLEPAQATTAAQVLQSPLSHPEFRRSYLKKPTPALTAASPVRKCLFGEKSTNIKPATTSASGAPQQRTISIALQVPGESGITYIPIQAIPVVVNNPTSTPTPPSTPASQLTPRTPDNSDAKPKQRRTGSLALFFRKLYHMAGVRMKELFERLSISDETTRKQIWTCFEHVIVNFTELMKDRHIDQIIMCSIYVMCKVRKKDTSFQEIMRCYRMQPQAASHVYRSVLIQGKERRNSGSSDHSKNGGNGSPVSGEKEGETPGGAKLPESLSIRSSSTLPIPHPNSQPPTPTRLTGTGSHFGFEHVEETRSDIVTFYNKVFVKVLENFAKKFSHLAASGDSPPLSPLPRLNSNPMSPFRRVSTKHSVYISPLKNPNFPPSPNRPLCYSLGRSPAKDLRAINNMVRMGEKKVGKRILADLQDEAENESPGKKICHDLAQRKIQDVMSERQGGNMQE